MEHPESQKLNLIQKIFGSARMGGISGPLVREFYSPECRCCAMLIAIVPIFMLCCYSMSLSTQLIQPSILFEDLGTSKNKGGLVDDGVESEAANSSLKPASSPSSRAVVARDEDSGVSIHSIVNDDESAYVSKPDVSKNVLPEPKNLSLKLKADDDGEVDPSVQDTIVDVSTLYVHCLLNLLRQLFLTLLLLVCNL